MPHIIPAIKYEQCRPAINWLCEVFGFEVHRLVEGPEDSIAHAQLAMGDVMVMVGSVDETDFGRLNIVPKAAGERSTLSLYLCVDDVAVHHARASEAGADIVIALKREEYGGSSYSCRDIEGHLWTVGDYNPWSDH